MPRSSSSSSASKSRALSSYKAPSVAPLSPPTVHLDVPKPTVWSSVKQGFGFGIGNSIAHNMFGSSTNPNSTGGTHNPNHNVTSEVLRENQQWKEYQQCLKEAKGDQEPCKHLMPELK